MNITRTRITKITKQYLIRQPINFLLDNTLNLNIPLLAKSSPQHKTNAAKIDLNLKASCRADVNMGF